MLRRLAIAVLVIAGTALALTLFGHATATLP
jgi:hypothetical protein